MNEPFDATTWPKAPNGRFLCTLAQPAPTPAPPGLWEHADTADAGGCSEGCCDDYRCRACGVKFRIEAAD